MHPIVAVDAVDAELMAGLTGERAKEEAHGATIALAKRVDVIELANMKGGTFGEGVQSKVAQIAFLIQHVELPPKGIRHEPAVQEAGGVLDEAVADPDFACPRVDGLEQMLVDGAEAKDRDVDTGEQLLLPDLRVQALDAL
jgi:hypothetical protein